jgi:tight adherence protein B
LSQAALPGILGALAGLTSVLALREFLGGSVAVSGWIRMTLDPLRRVRAEGYLPDSRERKAVALLAIAVAVGSGFLLGQLTLALVLGAFAPFAVGAHIRRDRRRYRLTVEKAVPETARAIADCLSAGHSPRGALAAVSSTLEGPAASEFSRLRHELELGRPTDVAVASLAARFGSERIDAFAAALVSQRLAGGDLAALLRRFAEGSAERDQVAEDARSATAQARFTGYLVVAMPAGAGLFAEMIRPGLVASLLGSGPALALVAVSVAMQAAAFAAISKLARIDRP